MCQTLEIEQERSEVGRCKRHGCESACGEGRECRGQVLMESVGRKSGRLERTSASNGQETMEETWKCRIPGRERSIKREENLEKRRKNEREEGHGRR